MESYDDRPVLSAVEAAEDDASQALFFAAYPCGSYKGEPPTDYKRAFESGLAIGFPVSSAIMEVAKLVSRGSDSSNRTKKIENKTGTGTSYSSDRKERD